MLLSIALLFAPALAPAPEATPTPQDEAVQQDQPVSSATPSDDWLTWTAPGACPSDAYIRTATEERLGRTPTAKEITVTSEIADRGADGLSLSLRTTRGAQSDTHELTAHDCLALADAAALIVALTVDAVAVAEHVATADVTEPLAPAQAPQPQTDPPVVETTPGPTAPPPPRPPGTDRAPPSVLPVAFMLAAGGGAELGALPSVSGGPSLWATLAWKNARLEVGGAYFAPRTATVDNASVRVQMGVAAARGCGRLRMPRVEVPLCAGMEIGGVRGNGAGAPDARPAGGLWLAPTASAGVHGWVLPRLAVFGRVEVAVPVASTAFDVRDPGDPVELFRPEPVSGRLWIGIEGKLWVRRDGSGGGRRTK